MSSKPRRATGTNPRAQGTNPRSQREAKELDIEEEAERQRKAREEREAMRESQDLTKVGETLDGIKRRLAKARTV